MSALLFESALMGAGTNLMNMSQLPVMPLGTGMAPQSCCAEGAIFQSLSSSLYQKWNKKYFEPQSLH